MGQVIATAFDVPGGSGCADRPLGCLRARRMTRWRCWATRPIRSAWRSNEKKPSRRASRPRRLRRSHQLQRDFFSRLSHELRTPLTAIRGYASSLLASDVTWDDESKTRFLNRISTESARMGRLVGDLLDFSAIESGLLRLQHDWCDLALVLEAAVSCLPPEGAAAVTVICPTRASARCGPTTTGSSRSSSTCWKTPSATTLPGCT